MRRHQEQEDGEDPAGADADQASPGHAMWRRRGGRRRRGGGRWRGIRVSLPVASRGQRESGDHQETSWCTI
jgi:hypothetical protein